MNILIPIYFADILYKFHFYTLWMKNIAEVLWKKHVTAMAHIIAPNYIIYYRKIVGYNNICNWLNIWL